MGLTVKVEFPDGVREVPAHIYIPCRDEYGFLSAGFDLSVAEPDPMDGWEFRQIIGGRDCDWIANETRPSRQPWQEVEPWMLNEDFPQRAYEESMRCRLTPTGKIIHL